MADKSLKSPAEIDREALDRFNRLLKESLDREQKLQQHYEWRGNKLPPFNIEPMPFERQRLATPMTTEERALRKQWVLDQKLSPSEPIHIPELYPQNPLRRLFAAPWNILTNIIKPVVGPNLAIKFRFYAPRASMTAIVVWAAWYHLKYHPQNWTAGRGWHITHSRRPIYPGDPGWPHAEEKEHDDFFDRGFKKQKNLSV